MIVVEILLIYLPSLLLTLTFLHNTVQGLMQLSSIKVPLSKIIWVNFLFWCYHLSFSTVVWQNLSARVLLALPLLSEWSPLATSIVKAISSALSMVETASDDVLLIQKKLNSSTGGSEQASSLGSAAEFSAPSTSQIFGGHLNSWPQKDQWIVNSSTSHTISAILGVLVYFGIRRTINYLGKRYKKMEQPAKNIIHMTLDFIFHMEFVLGTYIWFKYFFLYVFVHPSSASNDKGGALIEMSSKDAWNLAVTHTLAFSIGIFLVKDFVMRTTTKFNARNIKGKVGGKSLSSSSSKEAPLVRYYSLCAVGMLAFRVAWQLSSTTLNLPPPSDTLIVSLTSILLFAMLPSRKLVGYLVPPALVFLTSFLFGAEFQALIMDGYAVLSHSENWGVIGNVVCSLVGVLIGVYFFKGSSASNNSWGYTPFLSFDGINGILGGASGVSEIPQGLNNDRRKRAWTYPPPFPNGWYRIAGTEEVASGEVIQVRALGRQFAVFRGESGMVTVSDAFCPHLGANLALGGSVVGDELQCPFHEWRFDETGKCTHIPDLADEGPDGQKIPEAAKVRVWPVNEYMGNVYMWFDAEGRPPAYPTLTDDIFDRGDMIYYGETKNPMYLHPQEVAENSADFAHFNIVHGKLHVPFFSLFTYIRHSIEVIKDEAAPHVLQFNNKALIFSCFDDDVPLLPDNTSTTVTILGPSTIMYFRIFTPLGTILVIKTFLPHRALECTMTDRMYAEKTVPSLLAHYVFREAKYAFLEDGVIWNHKTYPKNPVLIKDDKPIRDFRRWYAQFYSPNSRRESLRDSISYEEEPERGIVDGARKPLVSTRREEAVFGCAAHAGTDW